jgi:hypothetical protein
MPEDQDPEKGDIRLHLDRPIWQPCVATEGDGLKELDYESPVDGDSEQSRRASSLDIIEAAPVGATQHSSRAKSQSSSVRSRPMSIIPRSKRRGLLGRFTIIPETERPYEYGNGTKWTITFVVALAAAAAPMGSAIFYRMSYISLLFEEEYHVPL